MCDAFFEKQFCDRCHQPLNGIRTQSMYNDDVLCMSCKDKETQRSDYPDAVQADVDAIKRGDYNFPGIGLKKSFPNLLIPLIKENKNVFVILAHLTAFMRKNGYPQESITQFHIEATSSDHNNWLVTVRKYANIL